MLENESKLGDVLSTVPPGISWTAPSKGRPWMNQPKVVDVSNVAQGYINSLGQAEAANDILDALESKMPLATIAEAFMLTAVNKGRHTLDAGILVMPVIIELLQSIADLNKIKTVKYTEDLEKGTTVPPRVLRQFMEQAKNNTVEEPVVEEAAVEPMGLMARKNKEVM